MIAAWRRTADGRVRQMIGNLASYAGGETEEEGAWSVNTNTEAVVAYRTSALKDWWAGTPDYVNMPLHGDDQRRDQRLEADLRGFQDRQDRHAGA